MRELSRDERMLLLRFACSFAWVDLKVGPEEREFIARMMRRLELDEEERRKVEAWLVTPPPMDSVDPALVPAEHRLLFVRAAESVISVDGQIDPAEREQLLVFSRLMR